MILKNDIQNDNRKNQKPSREITPRKSMSCAGWGGRNRTSEWRNQNPLPYRLATPQYPLKKPHEA